MQIISYRQTTVDPETGAVLRLTRMADVAQGDLASMLSESTAGTPLSRADMLVEYGPVEIGGNTYICPVRSVAISKARVPLLFRRQKIIRRPDSDLSYRPRPPPQTVDLSRGDITLELGPIRTYINDISFSQYHVFRSE